MTAIRSIPSFKINTKCACHQFPSLPRAKGRDGFGIIKVYNPFQVHGFWHCYDHEKEMYIGQRMGEW